MWYNTNATKIVGIDYPIMQGPFGGGLSSVEMVATVSNAGGLGGYGAYTLSSQEIIEVDNKIKAATNKPYNINLWVSDSDAPNGSITDEQYEQANKIFKLYFDEASIALPDKPAPFKSRFENQVQVILKGQVRMQRPRLAGHRLDLVDDSIARLAAAAHRPCCFRKASTSSYCPLSLEYIA